MTVAGTPLQLVAEVRGAAAAGAVFPLLDAVAAAWSAFETAPELWRIEAYLTGGEAKNLSAGCLTHKRSAKAKAPAAAHRARATL